MSTSLDLTKLFTSIDVYHDVNSRSAALNMAIDEALLETANVPTIRFYQWDHPALSFGYFGKFDDVADRNRDVVRRWTGGGIVFHGEDLTYSIVVPAMDRGFGESSMSIYEKVHRAICQVLAATRKGDFQIAPAIENHRSLNSTAADRGYNECFANPVRADVLSNGRKIAGAAQRRTRRGLLQQGSIQSVDVGNGFTDSFAGALCRQSQQKHFDPALLSRAEQIAAQKYGDNAWLRRR